MTKGSDTINVVEGGGRPWVTGIIVPPELSHEQALAWLAEREERNARDREKIHCDRATNDSHLRTAVINYRDNADDPSSRNGVEEIEEDNRRLALEESILQSELEQIGERRAELIKRHRAAQRANDNGRIAQLFFEAQSIVMDEIPDALIKLNKCGARLKEIDREIQIIYHNKHGFQDGGPFRCKLSALAGMDLFDCLRRLVSACVRVFGIKAGVMFTFSQFDLEKWRVEQKLEVSDFMIRDPDGGQSALSVVNGG